MEQSAYPESSQLEEDRCFTSLSAVIELGSVSSSGIRPSVCRGLSAISRYVSPPTDRDSLSEPSNVLPVTLPGQRFIGVAESRREPEAGECSKSKTSASTSIRMKASKSSPPQILALSIREIIGACPEGSWVCEELSHRPDISKEARS